MKQILTATMVLLCFTVSAHKYYFSTSTGDDSRSSTLAQDSTTPWKSITKLNSFFSSLVPGDSVLFKRGETFYGSIVVNKSGTSGSRIYIGVYGRGAKPVITSLVTLGGFVYKGNNIYESGLNASLLSTVRIVLIDGVFYEKGRYPNSDAANKGYLNFENHNARVSITDNELTSATNWVGAGIVVRSNDYTLDARKVSTHTNSTITFDADLSATPLNGNGYFITDDVRTLDKPGEWYHNPAAQTVSIYLTNNAALHTIQASSKSTLVSSSSFNNITFDSLYFQGANDYAVSISGGTGFKFNACDFMHSGIAAIKPTNHKSIVIQYCNFFNSLASAMYLTTCDNAIVQNNTVRNTLQYASGTQPANTIPQVAAAIYVNGDTTLTQYNTVINAGYTGIRWTGNLVMIRFNLVDTFSNYKSDGAAYYTWIGAGVTGTDSSTCLNNIALHGIGAPEGSAASISKYQGDGFYSDNNSAHVLWKGNTAAYCYKGIYAHYATKLTIRDNTFFDNRYLQADYQMEKTNLSRKFVVKNNIFFSKTAVEKVLSITDDSTDFRQLGSMDSNFYCRPILEPLNINNSGSSTAGGIIFTQDRVTAAGYYSLDQFKLKYAPWDAASKKSPKGYDTIRFEYNASARDSVIDLGRWTYVGANGTRYKNSVTLKPYTSVVLIRDTIIPVVTVPNVKPTITITAPANGATYTAPATIIITATASDADGTVTKVNFYNGSTLIGSDNTSPYSFTWTPVGVGGFSLNGHAIDNSNDSTISTSVTGNVTAANIPPVVVISAPADSAYFTTPAPINFTATATDVDGGIIDVKFYNGNSLFHTETSSPYDFIDTFTTGTYHIYAVAKDTNGDTTISKSITIFVNPPPALSINITADSINCHGGTTSLTVSATGGREPYTGTGTFVVSSGISTRIVIDADGNQDTAIVYVSQPPALVLTDSIGAITTYGATTTATGFASGGTPGYEYSISPGTGIWQASNVFNVPAGNYTLYCRDINGCMQSVSFSVTQPPPPVGVQPHGNSHKKNWNL